MIRLCIATMIAVCCTTAIAEELSTKRSLRLTVTDSDGDPIPNVNVELRYAKSIQRSDVTRGDFIGGSNRGFDLRTDNDGVLLLQPSVLPERLAYRIVHPGYAPYWAKWDALSNRADTPDDFTAVLESAWSVGGIIVDANGKPVEDASVQLSIEFTKRPGDTSQLGVGARIRTKANGSWQYDHVPVSMSDVYVSINHSRFSPLRQRLSRDQFGIEGDDRPTSILELDKGLTIRGQITDTDGNPIQGALVRTKFSNDLRETLSGADGRYELSGCESRMTRVVASSPGLAIDLKEVRVDADMPDVNFQMKPGKMIRVRIVDEEGKGLPNARIFFQRWRGHVDYFEFDHVDRKADENGVWEWNEAPADEIQADIIRPGGLQLRRQSLIAREEEYVFSPPNAVNIIGNVTDEVTGDPIEQFRVLPGLKNSDPRLKTDWMKGDAFDATDGNFKYQFRGESAPAFFIRIESPGYGVAVSREIAPTEGEVSLSFRLAPQADVRIEVTDSEGAPVAGAEIALGVDGDQISVKNGRVDSGQTYATRLTLSEKGMLTFPARDEPFQVVITHDKGWAHLKSDDGEIPNTVQLTPWAVVEGQFFVSETAREGIVLSASSSAIDTYGRAGPHIFSTYRITTGDDGTFRFDRLFPGRCWIRRNILLMVDDGAMEATSARTVPMELTAGQSQTVKLGGDGRRVVGQLTTLRPSKDPVLWNFANMRVEADLPRTEMPTQPPADPDDPELRKAWWESAEMIQWRAAEQERRDKLNKLPSFFVTMDRDGKFQIDDVPAGKYVLSVRMDKDIPWQIANYQFEIPNDERRTPIDLGNLPLLPKKSGAKLTR